MTGMSICLASRVNSVDRRRSRGRGPATIRRIEKSQAMTGYASTLVRIQAAFEKASVEFIDDDEKGGLGLRLVKKKTKR